MNKQQIKNIALLVILVLIIIVLLSRCIGNKCDFSMKSNDTVGATRYWVADAGEYEIVCTSGHGFIVVNDENGYALAADGYTGKEYGSTTYVTSVTVLLSQGDEILARNANSSDFKLEATLIN